jgi:hypothetical protein
MIIVVALIVLYFLLSIFNKPVSKCETCTNKFCGRNGNE